jgi:glutaredoxin 3
MASVEIYTRQYCTYCHYAKELLSRKGVAYREIDVTGNHQVRDEMIQRAEGHTTFPQIFIGSTYVGGCDELYALGDECRLDLLLQQGEDRPA